MKRFFATAFLFSVFSGLVLAQWSNGQAADVVIGQATMTSGAAGTTSTSLSTFTGAAGSVLYDSQHAKMYVFDSHNHRVLRFAYPGGGFSSNQPTAEAVLGQPDFTTAAVGTTSQTMSFPAGGAILDDTLWVAEYGNHRVIGFYNASTKTTGTAADVVLGQPDFITGTAGTTAAKMDRASGVAIDPVSRDLYVVEYVNHRVLKFLAGNKSTGASADLVFGQPNFTTGTTGGTFYNPWKVLFNNNNLFVVDYGYNRVLRFNNARSISSNQPAPDVVFGQPDMSTLTSGTTSAKLNGPTGVVIDGAGRLYVADQTNNRVVIFPDAFTGSNGPTASFVIGQADFTSSSTGTTSTTLFNPDDISIDVPNKKLFVVDAVNNRVLQYTASSALPVEITSLNATASGLDAKLQWKTATEVNNHGFEIQRRAVTDELWARVGFVPASGTSNAPHEYGFVDRGVAPRNYSYRIKQIDKDGSFKYTGEVEVEIGLAPKEFNLVQNYPNPFNPSTTIRFSVAEDGKVRLRIFNVSGEEVATLFNDVAQAGMLQEVKFDASSLPSGMYFSALESGNKRVVNKMILMK